MYFKKNLWQRIKFAFKTLLSDDRLKKCTQPDTKPEWTK